MSTYHGETLAKKIARASAYQAAANELRSVEGGIVCLAGPEAHDVGPISHFFPGSEVLFVDVDESGLKRAKERMPSCLTFHGQLRKAVMPWRVKLAVLDFCGHLEGDNFAGAVAVLRRWSFGGVALVTTLRARETKGLRGELVQKESDKGTIPSRLRAFADAVELGNALGLQSAWITLDGRRPQGLSGTVISLIDVFAYNGPVSPMQVAMYRKETVRQFCCRLTENRVIEGLTTSGVVAGRSTTPRSALEFPPAALDVSPGTYAAWKAHATMGTYSP